MLYYESKTNIYRTDFRHAVRQQGACKGSAKFGKGVVRQSKARVTRGKVLFSNKGIKMATKEQLEEAIKLIKPSYDWMVGGIKFRFDCGENEGNYSDELVKAIAGQELINEIIGE
jgi:hypothetical protein